MRTEDQTSPRPPERQPVPQLADPDRRTFLRGVLGLAGAGIAGLGSVGALAGCDAFGGDAGNEPQPHPLAGFLANTIALGGQYDAVLDAMPALAPTLTPMRDAHRAHARVVTEAMGSLAPPTSARAAPPASAAPTDRAAAIAALAAAEKSARDEAVAACMAGSARLAPLVGSIAAARASHFEVLK